MHVNYKMLPLNCDGSGVTLYTAMTCCNTVEHTLYDNMCALVHKLSM